ncbi:MAG: SWIM zinc finger family protein [Peptostreptococcaceae bacterium]|nr:SWIM zinc finger family protein [Peptostreptococcaceae bacterium]
MRGFEHISALYNDHLALALAPALTPSGIEKDPHFFSGEIIEPLVISRGLLVLADIVSTRYFKFIPTALRDPVLSAQGDRLRAECFSACNGVYARFDLLQDALDGEISFGTTNVDIGMGLRKALTQVKQGDRLRLDIGDEGLRALHTQKKDPELSKITKLIYERPVEMPDRWIRALGNCVPIHKNMKKVFDIRGVVAKNFIAMLPSASGKERSGWLTYSKTGVQLLQRAGKDGVYISGLHRLSSLKRVMSDVKTIDFYAPQDGEKGPMMVVVKLSGANLVLSLTAQSYQGYSGEGALLESLAQIEVVENADAVLSVLQFDPKIDKKKLSTMLYLSEEEVDFALALLAVSGKLGYDVEEESYFHRELPEEPDRVLKDNPRLVSAKKLLNNITPDGEHRWLVHSNGTDYRVIYDSSKELSEAKCTCAWYLRHQNNRGPCKHILAVKFFEES